MKITFDVLMQDQTTNQVTALVPDFIAWERHTKRKISDLASGISMEDMAYLAWSVLKRTGEAKKPYDLWINDIESIEPKEDDPKVTG